MKGKSLMFQGTGSSVGKSLLCAAVLRIMKQDGWSVAPFKAQNMALNSYATSEGLEMGRAQVTQAEAAEIEPSVRMNPVLLKPTSDRRSQVIVNGRPVGTMSAMEYEKYKPQLREEIARIYRELEDSVDCVVIEGAGSPAEINLREGDIVNMSMAKTADAPVILIGDINPGGVFASLYGTVKLLPEDEQARIRGIVINKFRGDVKILEPGLRMLEGADIILLPGTKNTIEDLNWLKQHGLADEIVRHARRGGIVMGICGGYQMLGERLFDPDHSESRIPELAGLGLLNFDVTFHPEKTTVQAHGTVDCPTGWLSEHNGLMLDGYEIHSGRNDFGPDCIPFLRLNGREEIDGVTNRAGNVLGTYLHGIFDTGAFWHALVSHVRREKGLNEEETEIITMEEFRRREYDRLADAVRANLDMDSVYAIIRGEDAPLGRWDHDDR